MSILVLGATGLLGSRLVPHLRDAGHRVVVHGRQAEADVRVDLSGIDAAAELLNDAMPEAVVNLVGLTDVDRCQQDVDLAYRLNAGVPQQVGAWVERHPQTRLIHVSTDQVYDAQQPSPEASVVLRNVYALTKFMGERSVAEAGGTVLRTNFFGRGRTPRARSISDWMIDGFQQGQEMTLFTDVIFSPVSFETLSAMISLALDCNHPGVFNLGSTTAMSKRDFAVRIAERLGLNRSNAREGCMADASLAAPRPSGMAMDSRLFEQTFGVTLRTFEQEIDQAEL